MDSLAQDRIDDQTRVRERFIEFVGEPVSEPIKGKWTRESMSEPESGQAIQSLSERANE